MRGGRGFLSLVSSRARVDPRSDRDPLYLTSARDFAALALWRDASAVPVQFSHGLRGRARFDLLFAGQFQPDREVAAMFAKLRDELRRRELVLSMVKVCDVPYRIVFELPQMPAHVVPDALALLGSLVAKFVPLEWEFLQVPAERWLCLNQVIHDEVEIDRDEVASGLFGPD